jgi:hypothetical protein
VIVTAEKVPTAITASAQPSRVLAGQASTISGTLSFNGVAADAAGQSIQVSVKNPATGQRTVIGTTTTDSSGDYSYPVTPPEADGTYGYYVDYLGDDTYSAAEKTVDLAVGQAVTTLTIFLSTPVVKYGGTLTVSAHLRGARAGAVVAIHRLVNGTQSIALAGPVTAYDELSFHPHPSENTFYWATYAGDSLDRASTSPKKEVVVQPFLTATISPPYGNYRGYRLYHYHPLCASSGIDCPIYTITFRPSNPGHIVYAQIQILLARRWRDDGSLGGTLGPRSMAAIKLRYANTSVVGHQFRVRAYFAGGPRYAANEGVYVLFAITR